MTQDEHFTFRNVPINGNINDVSKALVELGYKAVPDYGEVGFKGEFIGKDCLLLVSESKYTKSVYSITVIFNAQSKWSTLKSDFLKIEDMYTEKYGNTKKQRKSFDAPYYDGDGYEMSAILNNKCDYWSYWEVKNGNILEAITSDGVIMIIYSDLQNSSLHDKAKEAANKSQI